jgi:protein-S-isoprenylcysteine O-methyltransferase Ste14
MRNLEYFFSVLTNVWLVGEILLALFTTTRKGAGRIQDRGTQIILWVVIVGSFKVEEWMHRFFAPDMPGSASWLRPAALAILILGLGIRAAAIATLGRAFSANVAMRTGQELQRSGLYALVRHPSYLGLELILLALSVHSRTWACLAAAFVPCTLAVLYRIHVEEAALRKAFGPAYDEYSRNTKRLIPGVF